MYEHPATTNFAWTVSPIVARMAGLPAASLENLRFFTSFARVEELAATREWLAAEADTLSGALYVAIGASSRAGAKPALVGLRRALHRIRRPGSGEWNAEVAAALPPEIAVRVRTWTSTLEEYERRAAELPRILNAEMEHKQAELRETSAHPGFRRALSQASPSLFAELSKWLDSEERRPRRQSIIRLVKYVARAAAKTSPYSTFTISGLGRWTDGNADIRFADRGRVSGVLELNGLFLGHLVRVLCEVPSLSASLPLRVNPSATVRDDKITFLGRPSKEPIISMPATPAVLECLRILRDEPTLTRDGLCSALAHAEGVKDDSRRFIDALISAGLLEPLPPVDEQSPDPLGDLSRWMTANGDGSVSGIVKLIDHVRTELRLPVPLEDVEEHCARQERLTHAVRELAAEVGLPSHWPEQLGRSIFHENAVFSHTAVECALPRWRPALNDLDVLRRWLGVFDPALPLRLALGAYHRERFGSGTSIPLLAVHRALQEELAQEGGAEEAGIAREIRELLKISPLMPNPDLVHSHLPRLRELHDIREEALSGVLVEASDDGVIRVDPEVIAKRAAGWPEWVTSPESLGCYVQPISDPETLRLVLNVAHTGYGRGRSRLMYLIGQADGSPPPPDLTWRTHTAGRQLAEFAGTFSSSLNLRADSVPYEIDYPFTRSTRPAAERISVGDLAAVHDPETDMVGLSSLRHGFGVIPLHLGMMADILLPPVARLLTQAFGPTYFVHPSVPLLAGRASGQIPDEVSAYPRIEVGTVVLQRARWVVPISLIPTRAKGQTDAAFALRLAEWRRAHGIPARCFVRVWSEALWSGKVAGASWDTWILDKSRKPVYVDFANWFLVLVFERMLNGTGKIAVFDEALPALTDADSPADGSAVTEFLLEISGKVAPDA
ncbi:lantibiotic dehydratase [Nonomuraea diastatica]|uniref:Lantibiotic dehydratase N-terminal domain-containing protein n=1 Tax=Nonomuraea diastatica TaxID=1848329 RepID=A0A4R4WH62_9ACTN|nr:lantibiotic dehydratase [Nonomuraea diastatica]TDD12910.1 hypothetical protein E1294_43030 [Nonomuraea diastatica]